MKGRYEGKFPSGTEFWFQLLPDGRVEHGQNGAWLIRIGRTDWQNVVRAMSGEEPPPVPSCAPETGEIIGYRAWRVWWERPDKPFLGALHRTVYWMPGEPMQGSLHADDNGGVFAYKLSGLVMGHLAETRAGQKGQIYALGTVKMWGTVYEHEYGYRAEFAKVVGIDDVLSDAKRSRWPRKKDWRPSSAFILAALRQRYGVTASPKPSQAPLPEGEA